MDPSTTGSADLIVPWRTVSLSATLVAIASVAALVVAVSLSDSDALATVALALAILAFVVQIMVFIGQSWTSSQQMTQSQAINAQTLAALSELRTRAAGTEAILAKQVDTAMKYAFESAFVHSRKHSLTPDEAAEAFEQSIESDGIAVRRETSLEDQKILERLRSYPSEEEARELQLVDAFVNLSPLAASTLRLLAEDERDSRLAGFPPGVGAKTADSPGVVELIDAGLAEFDAEWDAEQQAAEEPHLDQAGQLQRALVLTPRGREVARLLLGVGPVPVYLAEGLRQWHEKRASLDG